MLSDMDDFFFPGSVDRRAMLQWAGLALAGFGVGGAVSVANGQEKPVERLWRFPRLVHDHYLRRVRRFERLNLERKAALKTREDAEAYVKDVRDRIRRCFEPFPAERTPLNAKVTGTVERDAYRIENVIFESRPGFFVTGNLYVPKGIEPGKPRPGVVGTCGHAAEGKGAEAYQAFAQGLARQGYVVLIYDPLGQGERSMYFTPEGKLAYPGTTHQHNMAGNQQVLVGEFLGSWRAWDGMRALDYLLTRPEVDPAQVGVTGNSGGGTLTTWLCGVEPRWSMGAPACFVTTWRRNYENELPQDSEQMPPRSLALGLDMDDYLAAMAPKPVIILAKEKDYFDVRGAEEAHARLKRLYALLGAEDRVRIATGPSEHGYSQENRESMYAFFNEVTKLSDAKGEPALTIEKQETLWCAPRGVVSRLEGAREVASFTAEKARTLAAKRGQPSGEELATRVRTALRLPPAAQAAPDYRIYRPGGGSRGYPAKRHIHYYVETEPGMLAICTWLTGDEAWYSRPAMAEGAKKRAVLYVAHRSADEELRSEPLVKEIFEAESAQADFIAMDARGVGESLPGTTSAGPLSYYGADYFYAVFANMLDRPYLGGKTWDVLRVLEWLAACGRTEVHLVAKGWGALPAAFAALLSPHVKQVTLAQALTSYEDVAVTEHYRWPLSSFVPNALETFDLPDVYRELAAKKLRQVEPRGAATEVGQGPLS